MVQTFPPEAAVANTPVQTHVPNAFFAAVPKAEARPAAPEAVLAAQSLTTRIVIAKVNARRANAAETKARSDCEDKKKELADAKLKSEQALEHAMAARMTEEAMENAVQEAEKEVDRRVRRKKEADADYACLFAQE